MMMDNHGLLWLVTEAGIARFDGNHFKTFNVSNSSVLIDNRLYGVYKMADNTLAVNDVCGSLFLIRNNSITRVREGDKSRSYPVFIKGGIPDTAVYEKMFRSCFLSDSASKLPWHSYPFFTWPVAHNSYWARGKEQMLLYRNGLLSRQVTIDKGKIETGFVLSGQLFFIDEKNEPYGIDESEDRLVKWKLTGDLLKEPAFKRPIISRNIFNKYGLNGAYIKIGHNLYTIERKAETRELHTTLFCNQLPVNCIITNVFFHPYYKILFIGTDTKGLYILKEERIKTLLDTTDEEGYNNSYYAQLALDSHHVVTSNNKIFGLEGVRRGNVFPGKIAREFLMRDRTGLLWFAYGDTIFSYDPVSRTRKFLVAKKKEFINVMYEEGDSIWIGSSHGISYLKDWKLHRIFNVPGLGTNLIPKCIYRHNNGQLYFMNCMGAFMLDTKTHKTDTVKDLQNTCIRTIVEHNNLVYMGTYGQGYYVWQNNRIQKMPLDKNKYLSEVHGFLFDKKGYVWMSTNNGLFKAKVTDIEHYLSDTTSVLYYGYFNKTDGIRNTEFNGGCSPSGISLANGYFSFPSMEGLVWFDPITVNDLPPDGSLLIDKVVVDNTAIDGRKEITLNPGFENLDVYITIPYWGNKENLQVEYMLEGLNTRWLSLSPDADAISFSKLPSGIYTLLIRQKAGYGIGNFVVASIVVKVLPGVYETPVFIITCSIMFLLVCWFGIRLYVNSIRQRTLSLERKVSERTSELIAMNEQLKNNNRKLTQSEQQLRQSNDLKTQLVSIISHDILTPLKFISMVARNFKSGNNGGEKEIIREIQHTSERLYENSQNILNWIKYQNMAIVVNKESVAPYSIVEDIRELMLDFSLLRKNIIENEVGMDDIVKTDKTIFTIILQNIISNAVKYTHSSIIKITSYTSSTGYAIRIADDGQGISESNLRRIESIRNKTRDNIFNHAGEGTGLGYVIIFDLVKLIGADIEIKSGPDIGTSVIVTLPNG